MKNKIITLNLVLLALVIKFANPLWATDYYINQSNPVANDKNAGTLNQPWKTISKANETLNAGDTVYIMAGMRAGMRDVHKFISFSINRRFF